MSSILFGDAMVRNKEQDSILLLGYSILYKEYNLTTKKTLLKWLGEADEPTGLGPASSFFLGR